MKASEEMTMVKDAEEVYKVNSREDIDKIITNLEFLSESMKNELKKLKSKIS